MSAGEWIAIAEVTAMTVVAFAILFGAFDRWI